VSAFDDSPARDPESNPRDTEQHETTRTRSGRYSARHETAVWAFKDPRKTKARIYRGYEGLPWALTDLVRKTNSAIARGDVPGKRLDIGDVVQACVVSYYCEGEVHRPQTTDDSPRYGTLPYRIVKAEAGHLSAEPALPEGAAIHFKLPVTVGDLIPTLGDDAKPGVLVSLQLKEAAYESEAQAIEEAEAALEDAAAYVMTDKADEEAADFVNFIDSGDRDTERTPAMGSPAAGSGTHAPDATQDPAETARMESARLKRKLDSRRHEDMQDFGFAK
jgi:hypothetical protein